MVKISVIVPVYNMEKYLDKCLSALVNQTFSDYEVIVVNDGSKDSSLKIMKEYQKQYPDIIKVFSNKNQGISMTRNFGIDKACGKYITFIDSDDYVESSFLEEMYKKIKKDDADICVCDYFIFNDNGDVKEFKIENFSSSSIKKNPQLLFIINSSPWNKLYKKSLFDNLRFEVIKYEDLLLVLKVLVLSKKITKLNKCLNYYRVRENSETTTHDRKVFDILKILDDLNEFFKEQGIFDECYSEIEYFNIYRTTMYILQQKYQKNKMDRLEFINMAYSHLDNNFPDWRKNIYYRKRRNILKRVVESRKFFSKLYVSVFSR